MLKRVALALGIFLVATSAFAQSVQQSGNVTRNHGTCWNSNGVVMDCGTANDSPLSTFGVDGLFGVMSDRASAAGRNVLTFQANTNAPATITLQNYGTAPAESLNFVINGTTYPFPGALASLIINSTPVVGGTNGDCLSISGGILSQLNCSLLVASTTGTGSIVFNTSPTLAGTIGGNLTFSGTEFFSGNTTFGSSLIVNGLSTPASSAGNTVLLGTVSPPTLTNNGQAYLFNTSIGGATLQGAGSTSDVTIANKNGGTAMTVPTGAAGVVFPGSISISGLSSGVCANSVVLNSSNQAILGSCPGAASSIQVGSTTISSGTNGNILYNNSGVLGNETIASILTAGTAISITGTTNATIALNGTTTAHGLAIWEGSSGLGNTGVGNLGQFAGSQGAGNDPTMVSGPWTLLATLTASNSASLNDQTACGGSNCINSTYNDYKLVFENLVPATTATNCQLQIHSGGSFQTTSYQSQSAGYTGVSIASRSATTYIPCDANDNAWSTGQSGVQAEFILLKPSQTSTGKLISGYGCEAQSGSTFCFNNGGQWAGGAGAVDGFQVLANSGNIASGSIKIYGRL